MQSVLMWQGTAPAFCDESYLILARPHGFVPSLSISSTFIDLRDRVKQLPKTDPNAAIQKSRANMPPRVGLECSESRNTSCL